MKQHTQSNKINLKELAFFGVYAALIIAFKEAMGVLPNIEPVTVMLIACSCVYGVKALLPAYVFSFVQIILHGFHIWNIMYLYVWALLVLFTLLLRPIHGLLSRLKAAPVAQTAMWTAFAALYGLCFGTLCAFPYFVTLGPSGALSWIISGFAFDIIHSIGNAAICAVAFYPLYKTLNFAKTKLA